MLRLGILALIFAACNDAGSGKDSGVPNTTGDDSSAGSDSTPDSGGDSADDSGGDSATDSAGDSAGDSDPADLDGDGVTQDGGDCDDADPQVYPGAPEVCDGLDQDCDGVADDGLAVTWYADADGDGFGDPAATTSDCAAPAGFVADNSDCDDSDSTIGGPDTRYEDLDGDGFGTDSTASLACPGSGVAEAGDCDDARGDVFPGAPEADCSDPTDYNCDGSTGYADADGDGAPACEECDDTDPGVAPGQDEVCDGVDQDCDGEIDEGVSSTFYADVDGDGFGDAEAPLLACEAAVGVVLDASDCDDAASDVYPGAEERCDGRDEDCDGVADNDAVDARTAWSDLDRDGHGDPDSMLVGCELPEDVAENDDDCDPDNPLISPAGVEVCNSTDDDCDGLVDNDSTDSTTWYADVDGDGFGDGAASVRACEAPEGYTTDNNDCDDAEAAVSPAGVERCNGTDDDCDGAVDEDAEDAGAWYADVDADGAGDPAVETLSCSAPVGSVADNTDCDDQDAAVFPGADEFCNGIDDDCDGEADEVEALDVLRGFLDADADGYGDPATPIDGCTLPGSAVTNELDCDDQDAAVFPGADEFCNGIDDDCDGETDEVEALDVLRGFLDADADSYGDPATPIDGCTLPGSAVTNNLDCDDQDAAVSPAAGEICNGIDDDCDGAIDDGRAGLESGCAAASCLDVLTDDPGASDGVYWIDVAGTPTELECDMTTDGGGWTLVFADDFESTPDSGWSLGTTYACGSWTNILGGYGVLAGGSVSITTSTLGIPHQDAWVELAYLKLDSWDGETASVSVDGLTLWSSTLQYYDGSEVCGWNRGWSGSYDDRHDLSLFTPHTLDSLTLAASSTLDQPATDESFGIDDVFVWVR